MKKESQSLLTRPIKIQKWYQIGRYILLHLNFVFPSSLSFYKQDTPVFSFLILLQAQYYYHIIYSKERNQVHYYSAQSLHPQQLRRSRTKRNSAQHFTPLFFLFFFLFLHSKSLTQCFFSLFLWILSVVRLFRF